MLAEYEAHLEAEPGPWGEQLARPEESRLASGTLAAQLWLRGADEVAGLAIGDYVPGVGRRLRVYLAPAYRTAEDLGQFLDELEERSDHDGPIASVADLVPGWSEASHEATFGVRGYFRVERIVMRLPASAPLPEETVSGRPDFRPLCAEDEEALVRLMRESYDQLAGEPSPWLFYRDPNQDARDAVQEILGGGRGEWLPWASFGVDVAGALKGATLVTATEVPLLSEVMVAPSLRGIGLGYELTLESVRALRERTPGEPHIVTTSRDLRALRLCRRLGFVPAEVRPVGVWVNPVAVGVPPPLRTLSP
jgi:GNAT superfamily N-acetyltransferase